VICVLRIVAEVDLYPVDSAVEVRVGSAVVVADRRAPVATDVGLLVQRKDHWLGPVNASITRLPAVDVKGNSAALGQTASVLIEFHPHLVLAGRYRLLAGDLEALQT